MRLLKSGMVAVLAMLLTAGCYTGPKTPQEYVAMYIREAAAKKRQGDLEGALQLMNRAIALSQNSSEAYARRGAIYAELNNTKAAMDDFNKALELNANNVPALIGRGMVRRNESVDGPEKALEDFDKAVELAPNLSQGHFARGTTLAMAGRTDDAIQELSSAIEKAPGYDEAYLWRAYCHIAKGSKTDIDLATHDLQYVYEHAEDKFLRERAEAWLSKIAKATANP